MSGTKKGLYIFLIIFLSILVIGLGALLVVGLTGKGGFFGFHFGQSKTSDHLVIDKVYDFDELDKVSIKIKSGAVKVFNAKKADSKVSLKFYADKDEYARVEERKHELVIDDQSKDCHFICFDWTGVNIELYLPEGYAGKLNVESDYGDIEIDKFELAELYLDSSAGDVKLGGAKDVKASLSAGNFELGDCFGELKVDNSMGNVKIDQLHLTKDSLIDMSMGNVDINNVGDVRVESDVSMGNSDINGGNYKSDVVLRIDNSMGNVTVH